MENLKIKLKSLFETKMYALVLLGFLFTLRFSGENTYGINKTDGWAFDITGFYLLFGFKILMCYTIGFSILALVKAKTNFFLSVLFLTTLLFCHLSYDSSERMRLTDYVLLMSIILFSIIFIQSFTLRIISTAKKLNP